MVKYVKYFVCGMLFLTSCQSRQENVVKIGNPAEHHESSKAVDLFENHRFILLEKNDSCLLQGNIRIVDVTEREIFVKDQNDLYRFDTSGRFMNRIGKVGHGHGEHSPNISNVCIDHEDDLVYMKSWGDDVYVYRTTGEYVARKQFPVEAGETCRSMRFATNVGFVCAMMNISSSGVSCDLRVFDKNFSQLKSCPLYADHEHFEIGMDVAPNAYSYSDRVACKLPFDAKMLLISKDACDSVFFDFGTMNPNRKDIEDVQELHDAQNKKVWLTEIMECNRYYFLQMTTYYDESVYHMVYDKKDKKIVYNVKAAPEHYFMKHPLLSSVAFWPCYAAGNTIYSLIGPEMLSHEDMRNLEKNYGLKNLSSSSNPIIYICEEKNE